MEDNKASAESIQKALSEINSESKKILDDIKKSKTLNETALGIFSNQLNSFQTQIGQFFPKLSSIRDSFYSTQSSFGPQSERGLIHSRNEEKATQLDSTGQYSPKFDRNESLGKLLCQAMKHFKDDLENFQHCATQDNHPIPLTLDGGKYFIGFCEHKKNGEQIESSTPLYGMLFENSGLEETLYVGKLNAQGVPETKNGLMFADLNFNQDKLSHEFKTPSGLTFPAKAYYKGEFHDGKFEGEGELVQDGSNSLLVKLPLLEPYDK